MKLFSAISITLLALCAASFVALQRDCQQQARLSLLRGQVDALQSERSNSLEHINQLVSERDQLSLYVTKRIVDLPEDGENLHTILFLATDWQNRPSQTAAKKLFETEPWCQDLRARTHWHVWTIDQPEAKPYWKFVTKTPCLLIQDCDAQGGRILYSEPNPDLAKKPAGLLHQINVTRKRQKHGNAAPYAGPCPDGVCPAPDQKKSDSEPKPTDEIETPAEKPAAVKTDIPIGVAVGIFLVTGALGYAVLTIALRTKAIRRAARH